MALGFLFTCCLLLAVCSALSFPRDIHLSLGESVSDMTVVWYTEEQAGTFIQYGLKPRDYTDQVEGEDRKLTYGDGWIHITLLHDLLPGKTYYYRVGDSSSWSEEHSFRARGKKKTVSFAAYGDMGVKDGSIATADLLKRMKSSMDFVIHAGDMAYAFGNFTKWDTFFERIQPVSSSVPYMISIGNRDEREFIQERFYMPFGKQEKKDEFQNLFYSFDYNYVHVASISIKDDFKEGSEQWNWLKEDLRSARQNFAKTPWIVFVAHTPMYSSSNGHTGGNKELKAAMEPLLNEFKVDIGIYGDDHGYERSYPLYNDVPDLEHSMKGSVQVFTNPNKTIHFVVGTAGIDLDGWTSEEKPSWSAFRSLNHGFLMFEASENKLTGHFLSSATGETLDQFEILKTVSSLDLSVSVLFWILPLGAALIIIGRKKAFQMKQKHSDLPFGKEYFKRSF